MARVCEDFNLSPVLARAHYEQMARYFAEYGQVPAKPGELCYLAVADDEPAGRPVAACRKVQVRLELTADEDRRALAEHGLAVMRRRRLARLARQARVQRALLTVEDLAWLTCSSPATVKRDLAVLRRAGEGIPTRGQIRRRRVGGRIKVEVRARTRRLAAAQIVENGGMPGSNACA